MKRIANIVTIFVLIFILMKSCTSDDTEWRYYSGGQDSNHFSSLQDINHDNVSKLKIAWEYDMEYSEKGDKVKCNPLIIDGKLYGTTSHKDVVALDAQTGKELWIFKPREIDKEGSQGPARGLSYWEKGSDKRLFFVYARYLYAINAVTGKLIESFGEKGRIKFSKGVPFAEDKIVSQTGPGVVFEDKLITGSFVSEYLPAARGDIRAINVLTGNIDWIFHTIPFPGEYGYETWPKNAYKEIGGVNNWGGMSVDEKRGMVFIPLASPTFDFYGSNRVGQNLYGNCLMALDAKTGTRIWHYQIIHHDLWDRDLPCQPNLVTVTHDGKKIDAVAQITKTGYVYLFERTTGRPLFEIKEVPVPSSTLPDEKAWPTQPIPVKPAPFARQEFKPEDITEITPKDNAYVKKEYAKYDHKKFAPPSVDGTIVMPFFNGGANWGGAAFNQENGLLFVNANDMPWLLKLIDIQKEASLNKVDGSGIYKTYCATCHGEKMEGGHYVPSLQNLSKKLNINEVTQIVKKGKGAMPAMTLLTEDQQKAVVAFVLKLKSSKDKIFTSKTTQDTSQDIDIPRYTNQGYTRFNDENGYPAIKPPWATLTAIDMNEGEIKWQSVLGEIDELTAKGIPITGHRNEGGPLITKSGLLFIAATYDDRFRAFDQLSGKKIWEYRLPGTGYATPSTYKLKGKQYIVLPVSKKTEKGYKAKYMAFALAD
jgi:quinoprotein glucose dehydrogenase